MTNPPQRRQHSTSTSTIRPRSALAGSRAAQDHGSHKPRPQSAAVLRPGNKHHPLGRANTPSAVKFEAANRPLDLSALYASGPGGLFGDPGTASSMSSLSHRWSEFDGLDEEPEANKYDDWWEDISVPLPEPAVFISLRPSGRGAKEQVRPEPEGEQEQEQEGELLCGPKASQPAFTTGKGNYDLVVCVCGHVNLRCDRAAHMKVCPVVTAAMGQSTKARKKFKARMKEASVIQEWESASKIQKMFRGYIARDYVRLRRKLEKVMATKIQTCWRATSARMRVAKLLGRAREFQRRREARAALCIQTKVRSWMAKCRVGRLRQRRASLRIQSWFRSRVEMYKFRERLKESHRAARTIQRCFRGMQGRRKVLKIIGRRSHAATQIQSCWRRHSIEAWFIVWKAVRIRALTKIQKVGRGMNHRTYARTRKIRFTNAARRIQGAWKAARSRQMAKKMLMMRTTNAILIQAFWRGFYARLKTKRMRRLWTAAAIVIQRYARRWLAILRLKQLRKERKARLNNAATKIQSRYRGYRTRVWFTGFASRRRSAATTLSMWWRVMWAVKVVRYRKKSVFTQQATVRRFLARCRYLNKKHALDNRVAHLLINDMADLELLSRCTHLFQGSLCPRTELINTLETLVAHKSDLRWLYLKYSMDGVGAPEKAFRMTKVQFLNCCKKINMLQGLDEPESLEKELPLIFDFANDDTVVVLRQKQEMEKLVAESQGIELDENPEELEADKYLQLDEFYVALVRVASIRAAMHQKAQRVAKFTRLLCQDCVSPYVEITKSKEHKALHLGDGVFNSVPGAEALVEKVGPRLEKIFKQVAASGSMKVKSKRKSSADVDKKPDNPDVVDAKEFLLFCKAGRLFDSSFSMSAGLDIFVQCNQEEINRFLVEPEPAHDLNQELKMEYAEFKQAFIIIGANRIGIGEAKKKKPEEYKKKFDKYVEDTLEQASRGFSHVIL